MRIAVTGGTGFLGSLLISEFLRQGHEVLLVTRQNPESIQAASCRIVSWPQSTAEDKDLLLSAEAVVHLAGENIFGRWTARKKKEIYESRIRNTTELVSLLKSSTKLKTFICASAVGYYGDRKTEVLTESSPAGEGFLAKVCKDWEVAAKNLKDVARVANLRSGVVLHRGKGFLSQVEPLYKYKIGGPAGRGEQMISWIHWQDWVAAVLFILNTPSIGGPVNLVAPEPISQRSFSHLMAKICGQKFEIPVPAFAIKMVLGDMGELVLSSQNARPLKLQELGFKFKYAYMKDALDELLRASR